jgi:hypothetical protein
VGLELYNGNATEAQKHLRHLQKAYPNDEDVKALQRQIKGA